MRLKIVDKQGRVFGWRNVIDVFACIIALLFIWGMIQGAEVFSKSQETVDKDRIERQLKKEFEQEYQQKEEELKEEYHKKEDNLDKKNYETELFLSGYRQGYQKGYEEGMRGPREN